jgi:PAS domain S-box-containing protein
LEAAEVAQALTTAAFVVLAGAAVREWSVRRAPAAGWFAISVLLIAIVTVSGYVLPEDSDSTAVAVLQKIDVVVLAFFPFALYRMTATLERTPRWLDAVAIALTAAVVLATLAVPASDLMDEDDRSGLFVASLIVFLLGWTFLSGVVAVRLWRAGRAEPVLARRRMRALAAGALGLSAALLFAGAESSAPVSQFLALASAALFFVGFVTPRVLRRPLGGHAEERFRSAVAELMGATAADEVTRALLSNATETMGGKGTSLIDADGEVIATHGDAPDASTAEVPSAAADAVRRGSSSKPTGAPVEVPLASSTLVVWTSPFTPVFGRHDLDALASLGRLAELALERSDLYAREREAHNALRRQIDFSRMLVESSVDGIMAFDRNYRYTLWNQGMERISGLPRAEVVGRPAFDVFPFLKEIGEDRYFDDALAGRDATSTDRRYDIPGSGAKGYFEARYSPLHGSEGDVVGGLAIISDVTDRKRAEAERDQRRREELARTKVEARNRMVESLQSVTDTTLGHLTVDEMVSELLERITEMLEVDVTALALLEGDEEALVIRAASGFESTDPHGLRIPVGSGFFGRVAAERRPVAVEELTPAHTHTPILRDEGVRTALGVPMIVGGRLIGALEVGRRGPHPFSSEDTGWLQLVADRVALAVEQSTTYEREHRIAETLQRSLLPESLPQLPRMGIAARYLSGEAGAVGGDWYDVIVLAGGRVGLAMGDVVGHGIGAASLMGQMRSALRAYALEDQRPSSVIRRLDRLLQSMGPTGMATLLYAVFDPDASTVIFASAGHPPPLVREPGGSMMFLKTPPSVPLGVQSAPRFEDREVRLAPGSTLVLYTDGLIERRDATLDQGLEHLERVVSSAPEAPDAVCDHILAEILPEDPADDTALLVLQATAGPVDTLHLRPPAEPRALASVRYSLRRWLDAVGLPEQEAYDVLVASGEACANAVEHAYGPGDASFELDAWVENGEVTISVRDFGSWRDPRGRERGRGIDLMNQLMDHAEVNRDADGTTVRLGIALSREAVA